MSQVKLLCPSVLCGMDDNFGLLEIKKSISKKAKNEIVLSRTGAMLSMANLDFRPICCHRQKKADHRSTK